MPKKSARKKSVTRKRTSNGTRSAPSSRQGTARKSTRKSMAKGGTHRLLPADNHDPKEIMLSFRFDRDTAAWLRAAAFWTRIPGAEIVRSSLRKELAALEKRFGRPFPRAPEPGE